jgi:hypothetical protein
MELVVASFVGIAVIVVVVWLAAVSKSVAIDTAKDREDAAARSETQRALERDRQMRAEPSRLRCLGCDTSFQGPLTDEGCPSCHSPALVIPEAEYNQRLINRQVP